MVAINDVQAQLAALDKRFRFVGVSEVRKLARILEPKEKVLQCMKGWHKSRSTLLCVTDQKIVCIDVRSVQIILTEINFNDVTSVYWQKKAISQLINIQTPHGIIEFTTWRRKHAQQLQSVISQHIQHLKNSYISSLRTVLKSKKNLRAGHSWRLLVRRMGATSIITD